MSRDGRYVSTVRSNALTVTEVDASSAVTVPTPAVTSPFPRMSFDAQGVRLALTDGDTNRVHVVDWRSGQEVTDPIDLFATFTFAKFLPDGRLFVQNGQRAIVKDLAAAAAPALVELPGSRQMPWPVDALRVSFTDDGRIATSSNTALTTWDAQTLSVHSRSTYPKLGDDARVISSPDGRRMTVAYFDPGGARWDVVERRAGRILGSAELRYQNHVFAVMSPDSSAQALLTGDGQIAVLGVGRDPGKLRLLDHDPRFPAVGPFAWFSPDGERLLVVQTRIDETNPRATVFDVASGRHRDLEAPTNVSQLMAAWSPDGKTVAFAAPDGRSRASTVALVDASTGKQIDATLAVENATFTAIGFAQSGRRVVALARSPEGPGSIRMWDVDGLLPIGDPIPVDPNIGVLRVSEDGSTAFALQFDYSDPRNPVALNVAVFDLTPKAWMRIACDVAGRPFSRLEWKKLLRDRPYDPACR
jgi:WD40 repeat protein